MLVALSGTYTAVQGQFDQRVDLCDGWSWLCLCGPVRWDEAFMPHVSRADHGTVI